MKILVTGVNGYLGRGIVRQLIEDGHRVIAADIVTDKCDARAERVNCDIFSIDDPYAYFLCPDILLHLAWQDGFVHNADSHIINLPHHHNFLLKFFISNISKVCVMGSMHEVGFYEGSIDENTPCNPMSLYGIAKNALRQDVQYMAKTYEKNYQWLRGFYIVANKAFGCSIFSKIVQAVEKGETHFPFTMGQNQFDFLDYNEFCLQVCAAVEQNHVNGIINICSGLPEKLADRVEQFIRENQFNIRLNYGAYIDRLYDSKTIWGNRVKIQTILDARHKG